MTEDLHKRDSENDELDALMDRALASYTPDTPRDGLAVRVLARLAADSDLHGQRWLPSLTWVTRPHWAWAAAVFAVVAVLVVVLLRLHAPPTSPNFAGVQGGPQPARALGPIEAPSMTTSKQLRQRQTHSMSSARRGPRFVPLKPTKQEALIAQLMANGPEMIASLAREQAEHDPDKPIAIKPIGADPLVIEPIKISSIDDKPAETGGAL